MIEIAYLEVSPAGVELFRYEKWIIINQEKEKSWYISKKQKVTEIPYELADRLNKSQQKIRQATWGD